MLTECIPTLLHLNNGSTLKEKVNSINNGPEKYTVDNSMWTTNIA